MVYGFLIFKKNNKVNEFHMGNVTNTSNVNSKHNTYNYC